MYFDEFDKMKFFVCYIIIH